MYKSCQPQHKNILRLAFTKFITLKINTCGISVVVDRIADLENQPYIWFIYIKSHPPNKTSVWVNTFYRKYDSQSDQDISFKDHLSFWIWNPRTFIPRHYSIALHVYWELHFTQLQQVLLSQKQKIFPRHCRSHYSCLQKTCCTVCD